MADPMVGGMRSLGASGISNANLESLSRNAVQQRQLVRAFLQLGNLKTVLLDYYLN